MLHAANLKKNKGFILVSVLLLMQLLAILSCYALADSAAALQTSRLVLAHTLDFIAVEAALGETEITLLQGEVACQISPISWTDLLQQPSAFWQTQACHAHQGTLHYDYIVETLALDPCLQLFTADGQWQAAKLLRLTLRAAPSAQRAALFLQSTVATIGMTAEACTGTIYQIAAGRIAWRQGEGNYSAEAAFCRKRPDLSQGFAKN